MQLTHSSKRACSQPLSLYDVRTWFQSLLSNGSQLVPLQRVEPQRRRGVLREEEPRPAHAPPPLRSRRGGALHVESS
jgi:hypothetical protein